MTTKRITWNTGALYSREGQVITAEFDFDTRRVIFKDHSRLISGVFRARAPATLRVWDLAPLREFVLTEYLHNRYDFDATGDADRLERIDRDRPTAKRVARATTKVLDAKRKSVRALVEDANEARYEVESFAMINHPNRSKRREPRIKVTLANSGGTLDERIVSAHPDWTEDQIAEVVARSAIELIRETRFLHAGDVVTVTEIERS